MCFIWFWNINLRTLAIFDELRENVIVPAWRRWSLCCFRMERLFLSLFLLPVRLSVEVDECVISPDICGHGFCYNTAESYYCICDEGYKLNEEASTCAGEMRFTHIPDSTAASFFTFKIHPTNLIHAFSPGCFTEFLYGFFGGFFSDFWYRFFFLIIL